MKPPQLQALASLRIIVKGRSLEQSREHVVETVARLLSRRELFLGHITRQIDRPHGSSREEPVPQQITKIFIRNQTPCYQVMWKVKSTFTNRDGEDLNGFEYTSIEQTALFDARFQSILPQLLAKCIAAKKERKKQGDAEQSRRREFLDQIMGCETEAANERHSPRRAPTKSTRKRQAFFQSIRPDPHAQANIHNQKLGEKFNHQAGEDVLRLLGLHPALGQAKKKMKCDANSPQGKSHSSVPLQQLPKRITIHDAVDISPLTRCTFLDAVSSSPSLLAARTGSHGTGS